MTRNWEVDSYVVRLELAALQEDINLKAFATLCRLFSVVFRGARGYVADNFSSVLKVAETPAVIRQRVEDVVFEVGRRIKTALHDLSNVSLATVDRELAGARRFVFLNDTTHAQTEDGQIGRIRIVPS